MIKFVQFSQNDSKQGHLAKPTSPYKRQFPPCASAICMKASGTERQWVVQGWKLSQDVSWSPPQPSQGYVMLDIFRLT